MLSHAYKQQIVSKPYIDMTSIRERFQSGFRADIRSGICFDFFSETKARYQMAPANFKTDKLSVKGISDQSLSFFTEHYSESETKFDFHIKI